MSNATIAIDLDEVLSPFVPDLLTWYNETYKSNFSYEQYTSYDFSELWGGSQEDASAICDLFHNSRDIREIQPIPNAVKALSTLKNAQYKLVLVTSRPLQHAEYTHSWIEHHLPNLFSEIILCNHWTKVGKPIKKSDACKQINAQYFIDDLPFYIEEVANSSIQCLLFGDYPWNKKDISHENIKRVSGWDEVLKILIPS